MKAEELRVGNFVINEFENYKGKHKDLTEVSASDMIECEDFKPISLTEEWLFRFGFEKKIDDEDDRFSHFIITDVIDIVKYENREFTLSFHSGYFSSHSLENVFSFDLKYVHQLQNLYYALTQTELQI